MPSYFATQALLLFKLEQATKVREGNSDGGEADDDAELTPRIFGSLSVIIIMQRNFSDGIKDNNSASLRSSSSSDENSVLAAAAAADEDDSWPEMGGGENDDDDDKVEGTHEDRRLKDRPAREHESELGLWTKSGADSSSRGR